MKNINFQAETELLQLQSRDDIFRFRSYDTALFNSGLISRSTLAFCFIPIGNKLKTCSHNRRVFVARCIFFYFSHFFFPSSNSLHLTVKIWKFCAFTKLHLTKLVLRLHKPYSEMALLFSFSTSPDWGHLHVSGILISWSTFLWCHSYLTNTFPP